MKFINKIAISEVIDGYYIDPIDIEDNKDLQLIQKIHQSLLSGNEKIFILFHNDGPDNTSIKEVVKNLKSAHPFFHTVIDSSSRQYYLLSEQFLLTKTLTLLIQLWKTFKDVRWFVPREDLSWEKLLSYEENVFMQDPDGKKMLNFDFANLIFIKGIGGESIHINYKKNHQVNSLEKLLKK